MSLPPQFSVKVVGVSFHPDYPGNLHRLRTEGPLAGGVGEASLIREPDNRYDPNAVAVLVGGEVIGHVPRMIASRLAPMLDAGARYRAQVTVLVAEGHDDQPGVLLEAERVMEVSQ